MKTITGGVALEAGKPLPKKLSDEMDLPFKPKCKELDMTDMERKIAGYLMLDTPDDDIRGKLDASQAEIVMVRTKYPGVVKPADKPKEKEAPKNAGAVVDRPAPVERPAAIKETDEKVQPKAVKQGPPRDENAERAKLAKIQGASAVVDNKSGVAAVVEDDNDKSADTDTGKKNEETGGVADGEDGSAPAAKSTGVNPENVLDQNAKTVIKKVREENYNVEDMVALMTHEEKHRKRNSVIKFIKKKIEDYVNE